jgi:mannose/fructose/N-acetylgalactosamine-specific phosphotransferase system component IIC
MQGLEHTRPLTNAMRWMLPAASILVFLAGIQLFILTEYTDRYFAWTINSPLTAAALGGAYWASSIMELSASRQPSWARARIAVPAVLLFTTLTFVTTVLHLDNFHLGNGFAASTQLVTWLWILVYALVPVLMSILLVLQLRTVGVDEPRTNPLPPWLRVVLGLHAVVLLAFGFALFVAPAATLSLWPWTLTPLTARAIGAWLLGLGLAATHASIENDWGRATVAAHSYVLLGILEFVALMRYPDSVDWARPAAAMYVLFLASVLLVGIYGLVATRRIAHRSMVGLS